MGSSRQEHWSRLPFPSPMHENEKGKWSRSVVPTLSDPMDWSLPGSSVHGIFQAKECWSGVPLPAPVVRACKSAVVCCSCCLVTKLCSTPTIPWTVALQAPLSMRYPRQEYWSGLPFPFSGDLPDSGIELLSPASQAGSFTAEPSQKPKLKLLARIREFYLGRCLWWNVDVG